MKPLKPRLLILASVALGTLLGCSFTCTKSAEVAGSIRSSLGQAGFKDVSVSQDQTKGVVTLGGRVASIGEKAQAESIAKSLAAQQVVANAIAVVPPGAEKDARQVNSDLDKGIDNNLHAALVVANLDEQVKYTVKNHVVTLAGDVDAGEADMGGGGRLDCAECATGCERTAGESSEGNFFEVTPRGERAGGESSHAGLAPPHSKGID